MDNAERNAIFRLALGRIFRLASRPTQPGDVEQYEAARRAFWAAYDTAPFAVEPDRSPNHARYHSGSHGRRRDP